MRTKAVAVSLLLLALPALAAEPRPQPSGVPGTVTLPLPEYDRLLERARKDQPVPAVPPVEVALARAEARGAVADGLVRGTLTLEGEVYAHGLVRLPIASGLTLLDARSAGRPVPLVNVAGQVQALLRGPGVFTLQLDWAAPVTSDPGRASFVLAVPRAGSVRALLDLPGEHADVALERGAVTKKAALVGKTRVEATLEPGGQARFSWSAREAALLPAREARLLSDVKTLVAVGEGELSMVALVDVSVVEGEPESLTLQLPEGFELTGVSGSTLESTSEGPGTLTLGLRAGGRRHQCVLSLARAGAESGPLPLVTVRGTQRETGEVGLLGQGTVELQAHEGGTLRRMDPAEASAGLRALSSEPLLLAFRYHRREGEAPTLAVDVQRFEPATVLPALAERGVATTLVTAEGRLLTEVKLTVRNQAQPFLKVELPEPATLLSAEVAGQAVKPVSGQDGTRVPLLRAGFRPSGPYEVSFVYQQPGTPFGKKGQARVSLPRFDLPVSLVEWELFLPERYEVKSFEGNARRELALAWGQSGSEEGVEGGAVGGVPGGVVGGLTGRRDEGDAVAPLDVTGLIGRVTDAQGGAIPGATVQLTLASGGTRTAVSDPNGWYVFPNVPRGRHRLTCELQGFATRHRDVQYSTGRFMANFVLNVGAMSETVEVVGAAPTVSDEANFARQQREEAAEQKAQMNAPSSNVFALQRRVAGVLPVRVEVPRSGESYRFARALALEEATTVSFSYRSRRK